MNATGLFISRETMETFSPELRAQVIQVVFGHTAKTPSTATISSPNLSEATSMVAADEDEHFLELSPRQAREYVAWCSPNVRTAIETIVSGSDRFFQVADVSNTLGIPANKLRSVWAGITRRGRTVSRDQDGYLIAWTGDPQHDEHGVYIDQRAEVTQLTFQAFRRALNIE